MIDNGNPHANGNGAGHGVAELAAPPAPLETPAEVEPSPETLLFRTGLLNPDQLGELVQERVGSGRSVEEIVVERGWLDADTVARALGQDTAAAAEPTPVAAAAPHPDPFAVPVVELAPQPQSQPLPEPEIAAFVPAVAVEAASVEPIRVEPLPVEPVPAESLLAESGPAAAVEFRVSLRFVGSECVEVASHADAVEAKAAAYALVQQLSADDGSWPFVGGRFVRPEAVLSVDVDAVVR